MPSLERPGIPPLEEFSTAPPQSPATEATAVRRRSAGTLMVIDADNMADGLTLEPEFGNESIGDELSLEPDVETARVLPFSFAKRHGVLIRD